MQYFINHISTNTRREDRGIHNTLKNTQTCFTAQIATTLPDATEFFGETNVFRLVIH